ncbi:hypothetical protein DE146DRAFT_653720 [Phaeosphaeria sp. MPI-PUGE-AT-0046c]|nr:hypothetical protein DE146DRAFT_653720 [Phaeosphaeria sp. MPI-PUGE-AT-0046c]
MEQQKESSTGGLENQLRGMILGNVRISDGQASQQTGTHTTRGRGRGRGYGRGNYNDRPHGQAQHTAPVSSPVVSRRGGFDTRGRGYHQQSNQPQHHNPQNSTFAARGQKPIENGQAQTVLQRTHQNHASGYGRGGANVPYQHRPQGPYTPHSHPSQPRENPIVQIEHLDRLAAEEVPKVEMSLAEFEEKEQFRSQLEGIFRQAFTEHYPTSGDIAAISLVGFGSLASGFGMPGSDMDLAVVPGWKDPSQADRITIDRDIPRLLERAVLDAKMGGRLLTRTRVPILKVCQSPTEALYSALTEERKKWDDLPEAEQYPTDAPLEASPLPKATVDAEDQKTAESLNRANGGPVSSDDFPELGSAPVKKKKVASKVPEATTAAEVEAKAGPIEAASSNSATENVPSKQQSQQFQQPHQPRNDKAWVREKVLGPLDFPKQGVGIQCDINFENPLGIHNTHMLRCYSLTDPRVRLIVLFVKAWAKRRKVNSSYSGTLSSYGWVLMVLHYLVNIAKPPVCPNLQHSVPQPKDVNQLETFFKDPEISGYKVRFWRNEQEIMQAAQSGQLTQNRQSIGELLRGFFQYYASSPSFGNYAPRPFYWTNEVLSLRTPGGIRTKQDKGWVSAKTTITAEKKVTNRYLFAIEDPFELDHNVARTVTHRGIVAIRDEFRRAWRILAAVGKGMEAEGGMFDEVVEPAPPQQQPKEDVKQEEVEKVGSEDVRAKEGIDAEEKVVQKDVAAVGL